MLKSIRFSTVLETLLLADLFYATELKEKCMEFMRRFQGVMPSLALWPYLRREHPQIIHEVFPSQPIAPIDDEEADLMLVHEDMRRQIAAADTRRATGPAQKKRKSK